MEEDLDYDKGENPSPEAGLKPEIGMWHFAVESFRLLINDSHAMQSFPGTLDIPMLSMCLKEVAVRVLVRRLARDGGTNRSPKSPRPGVMYEFSSSPSSTHAVI